MSQLQETVIAVCGKLDQMEERLPEEQIEV